MRVLLVTSQVTYVPRNYQDLFEVLVDEIPEHIAGMVILKNLSLDLVKTTLGLTWLGCPTVAKELAANVLQLPWRKRETLLRRLRKPVLYWDSMNSPEAVGWVKENAIDLVVNLRTRCIYKSAILNAPRLGCINIHHGILPDYRGTLCDLYALSEERPAGFTIHVMNEKIDAGRILYKQEVSAPRENHYVNYLAKTGIEEGRALSALIREIAKTGRLPAGESNLSAQPVFTRNPSRDKIKAMKEKGLVL